jgi:single-strand DNA-binding protein
VVILNEGLVNVVQQYVKKGANVYVEGQLSTRKWKDESTGQDKYSTEIVLQGYNSSLTMLDSRNSVNSNSNLVSENKSSLPNDSLNQENSDLDDEIPF